jgi:hypothetical protein
MTKYIVLNDAVRNTDKLNIIKMTGEILEIVGDNIDSSRILLVTKINSGIPRVTKLPAPTIISLSLRILQFDVINISVLSHKLIPSFRLLSYSRDRPKSIIKHLQSTKVNVYRFKLTRQGLLCPN